MLSLVPIEEFTQNVLIVGESKNDKTVLLRRILKEFATKAPDIGILYTTFDKEFDKSSVDFDYYYKYPTAEFTVPFFCKPKDGPPGYDILSRFLVAIFNLHPELYFVFSIVLNDKIRGDRIPESFLTILQDVVEYQKDYPYDDEFQEYLLEHLNKSIKIFSHEPSLEKTVRYSKEPPEWFNQWKLGKKIIIDFSECGYLVRMLLFGLVIQLVNNMMPHTHKEKPQGLIIVEDGLEIFSKYPFDEPLEMYDARRETADKILSNFVNFENTYLGYVFERWIGHELGYRNVSVVTVTSSLTGIFKSIAWYSGLIVLFKPGVFDSIHCKYREDIKDIILNLQKHQAIVLSSNGLFKIQI